MCAGRADQAANPSKEPNQPEQDRDDGPEKGNVGGAGEKGGGARGGGMWEV